MVRSWTGCQDRLWTFHPGRCTASAGCSPVTPYHLAGESQLPVMNHFHSPRLDANRTAAGVGDIYRHAGMSERSQPPGMAVVSVAHLT